uniref:Uncharacterized protein n=1 Tax=Arundo donax TaxID=35708 RepID=A0A0A9G3V9_ARUDO
MWTSYMSTSPCVSHHNSLSVMGRQMSSYIRRHNLKLLLITRRCIRRHVLLLGKSTVILVRRTNFEHIRPCEF